MYVYWVIGAVCNVLNQCAVKDTIALFLATMSWTVLRDRSQKGNDPADWWTANSKPTSGSSGARIERAG
jgi:hypothetical protein